MTFEIGQEVYTEDGRKAEYAGEIGGQKFVRIMLYRDDEYGPEEWPGDKLTPVSKVFTSAPMEKHDQRVADAQAKVSKLRDEEAAVRRSVMALQAQEKEAMAAVAKFPELRTALDFLEGRITHVVIESYGTVEVKPLQEALAYYDDDGNWGRRTQSGLKLLCLFGHEKGKKPRWAINHYYDGSGLYTTVDPFTSEAEARAEVQRRADAAFLAWKADGKHSNLISYEKAGATIPQEYLDHIAAMRAEAKAAKAQKLREELAALEGGAQ